VLDVRVYRAAFLPALVAAFVAAFSLLDRPPPATSPLAADAFDGSVAFGDARRPRRNSLSELASAFPSRRPGEAGDAGLAERVASTLGQVDRRTRRGAFEVTRTSLRSGDADLETVVGVRPGLSSRRIVVLANRDARGRPGRAELSATATLLELARVFRQRDLRKTLVLVSTSGATTGFAGARAWAAGAADGPVDAVLVLGDMAGAEIRKPWVVPWSTTSTPAPLRLQRTVESAFRGEVAPNPGGARASGQWVRRALPLTLSGQGVVAAQGLPAVLVSASGERGAGPDAEVSRARLESFGQGVLRAVAAIDAAGPGTDDSIAESVFASGPDGIVTMRNVLPDWAVRMLVATLLLPSLLAALDAWFRARRRRLSPGRWAGWIATGAVPLGLAWLWLRALGATGALEAPAAPVDPAGYPIGTAGAVALASTVVVAAVGWFGLRPLMIRRLGVAGSAAAGGLASATGLVINGLAAVVWVANPYAAALLLPAAHLWLLAGSPSSRLRGMAAAIAVVGGLLLPALAAFHYARALGLDPLELAWLAALISADGHISAPAALAAALWLACLAGLLIVVRTRRQVAATTGPEPMRTRGPSGYAGPGSLGGTESALRR
jgi:hypothetical protein